MSNSFTLTCPIYEEFTFNDKGEMTFIEAWSDLPGFCLKETMTVGQKSQTIRVSQPAYLDWAMPQCTIDLESKGDKKTAAQSDPELADFAKQAGWTKYWREEVENADPDFFAIGCGWMK